MREFSGHAAGCNDLDDADTMTRKLKSLINDMTTNVRINVTKTIANGAPFYIPTIHFEINNDKAEVAIQLLTPLLEDGLEEWC